MIREFIDAILANWQLIKDSCPKESWLPTGISEDEYLGYGSFGCVFKTNDDGVVFKITTDISEYDFVGYLMRSKKKFSGIVKYFSAIEIKSVISTDRMFVMWRESAHAIGYRFDGATSLKFTGDSIYGLTKDGKTPRKSAFLISLSEEISNMNQSESMSPVEFLASELNYYHSKISRLQKSEIRKSLLDLFVDGWILCDIREPNIGFVTRGSRRIQVIIDPGMAIDFW